MYIIQLEVCVLVLTYKEPHRLPSVHMRGRTRVLHHEATHSTSQYGLFAHSHTDYSPQTCRMRKWRKTKGEGGAWYEDGSCLMAGDISEQYQSQIHRPLQH
jgi:hypothetical protein